MEIKNKYGTVLFKNDSPSIKETIEEAVRKRIRLSVADLGGANLNGAYLNDANLRCADLSSADLRGADLIGADLIDANFKGADLRGAHLRGANLKGAYLNGANLNDADIKGANLIDADLIDADLTCTNIIDADLSSADLRDANLRGASLINANLNDANLNGAYIKGANLRGAENVPYIPLACPSEGSFIGWKKIRYNKNEYLVKLRIPEDARRCSATTLKCRCDKAEVLAIECLSTSDKDVKQVVNRAYYNHECTYKVGEMVYPDSFDENRWNECSHGIHFFINKQDAIDY